jgi:formylglycine-generating enzyme required for sulfatase activity
VLGALLVGGVVLWWQLSHRSKSDGTVNGSTNAAVPGSVPDKLPAKYKNSLGTEFVLVPKGKFLMGGTGGNPGTKEVEIKHDFYLGQYEVTQWEWMQVMGNNPSNFQNPPPAKPLSKQEQAKLTLDELQKLKEKEDRDKENHWKSHPVENVSWEDCQKYIERLNQKEKTAGWEYRLPTEAEWEYACRGGSGRPVLEYGFDYYFERPANNLLPEMANFQDSGKNRTCKVGSYKPNRLGLYDMHGNVWEWCQDEIPGDLKDPKAASQRVNRGGSWDNDSGNGRAANRGVFASSVRYATLGLRLARVPVTVPAPANAPFDAEQARAHQQAWATHLGMTGETTNSIGMKLALIPAGKFRMGSPDNEPGREKDDREGPRHEVEITRPFYLGVYPVTVGQFREFVNARKYQTEAETGGAYGLRDGKWGIDRQANWRKPGFQQTDTRPVVCVSWNDAQAFCAWLSKKEGRTYRLPTEAEWEYSCRAGTFTRFYFGNDDSDLHNHAWYEGNSKPMTYPVGEKQPNAWGLCDMAGNVRNWCQDRYGKDYYKNSPKQDPPGPIAGDARVVRGGSWYHNLAQCRSAYRGADAPLYRGANHGFRVVLVPASQ